MAIMTAFPGKNPILFGETRFRANISIREDLSLRECQIGALEPPLYGKIIHSLLLY